MPFTFGMFGGFSPRRDETDPPTGPRPLSTPTVPDPDDWLSEIDALLAPEPPAPLAVDVTRRGRDVALGPDVPGTLGSVVARRGRDVVLQPEPPPPPPETTRRGRDVALPGLLPMRPVPAHETRDERDLRETLETVRRPEPLHPPARRENPYIPDDVEPSLPPLKRIPRTLGALGLDQVMTDSERAISALEPAGVTRGRIGGEMLLDLGISALKGAVSLPETAIGLMDLVMAAGPAGASGHGGFVGRSFEHVGLHPRAAQEILSSWYSTRQRQANLSVEDAEGILATTAAVLKNPSVVAHKGVESLPLMFGGGLIGRGIKTTTGMASTAIPAGMGEGLVAAGSAAEGIRQQTPGGTLSGQQAALAATSGVATGTLGWLGGKIAQSLGIADIDTMVAGAIVDPAAAQGLARQVVTGAFQEGILEELPQSVQEQVAQNLALGRPITDGLDTALVLSAFVGGVMGSGAQVYERGRAALGSPADAPGPVPPPAGSPVPSGSEMPPSAQVPPPVPPAAVGPGGGPPGAPAPVTPAPEPLPGAPTAAPDPEIAAIDEILASPVDESGRELGGYAGPERRGADRISTPAEDERYTRMREKIARGEPTVSPEARADLDNRNRVRDAKEDSAIADVTAMEPAPPKPAAEMSDDEFAEAILAELEAEERAARGEAPASRPFAAPERTESGPFVPGTPEGQWPRVLQEARALGYRGSDEDLRARYDTHAESAQTLIADMSDVRDEHSPTRLLSDIRKLGGLKPFTRDMWKGRRGARKLRGDLEAIVEGFASPSTRGQRGASSIFRNDGLAPDDLLDQLHQGGKWSEISDVNDLVDRLDKIARTATDKGFKVPDFETALGVAGVRPDVRWWADRPVPKTRGLSEEAQAVEEAFRARIENDLPGMTAEYRRRFGNVVSADLAKELSPEYATSNEARGQFNQAVHRGSSILADAVYRQLIAEPTPDGKQPIAWFVVGPTGAGKSTIINAPESQPFKDSVHVVVDGIFSDYGNATDRIDAATAASKDVAVVYVHRDPAEAWGGVRKRARAEGRQPPFDYHVQSHSKSVQVFHRLTNHYSGDPRVSIEVYQNIGGQGLMPAQATDVPEAYNEQDVRAAIQRAEETAGGEEPPAGRLPEESGRGDRRRDGPPRPRGSREGAEEVGAAPPSRPVSEDKPPKIKNPRSWNEGFLESLQPFKGSDGTWYHVDRSQPDFNAVYRVDGDDIRKVRGFYPGSGFYADDIPGVTFEGTYERITRGEILPTTPTREEWERARSGPSFKERIKQLDDEPETHEYSSTQVNLGGEIREAILALGRQIADKDLAEGGREQDPHVTIKYGLHTEKADAVRTLLAGEKPITLRFGKTSLFPPSEGSDGAEVVKIDVHSPDLHRLNATIAKALEHTDSFPDYTPHATVAYVKAGTGQKYVGLDALDGKRVNVDAITFSSKTGETVQITLGKKEKASGKEERAAEAADKEVLSTEREALIARIVAAAREPDPEIVEQTETKGSDGKWYLTRANSMPWGVRSTDETRSVGYAILTRDGTTVGKREPTREAVLERWRKAEDAKAEEFRSALAEMDDEQLRGQQATWLFKDDSNGIRAALLGLSEEYRHRPKPRRYRVVELQAKVAQHAANLQKHGVLTDYLRKDALRAFDGHEKDLSDAMRPYGADLSGVTQEQTPPASRPAVSQPAGTKATIRHNTDRGSIEVSFPAKPDRAVLDTLKAAGFRWAKSNKVWYHKIKGTAGDARYMREHDRLMKIASEATGVQAPAPTQGATSAPPASRPAVSQPTTPKKAEYVDGDRVMFGSSPATVIGRDGERYRIRLDVVAAVGGTGTIGTYAKNLTPIEVEEESDRPEAPTAADDPARDMATDADGHVYEVGDKVLLRDGDDTRVYTIKAVHPNGIRIEYEDGKGRAVSPVNIRPATAEEQGFTIGGFYNTGKAAKTPEQITAKARELWDRFTENARAAVRIGVFPAEAMAAAEKEGFTGQQLAVALMDLGKQEAPTVDPKKAERDRLIAELKARQRQKDGPQFMREPDQPRLPGAENARQAGKADTTFKAPQQATGDDFTLEGEETAEGRRKRQQAEEDEQGSLFMREPRPEDTAPFYSRLSRTVEQSPQGRATGAQWKATIRNSKLGVNKDEFTYAHVDDLEDGKVYTKQEVLNYLKANEVKVEPVVLGGTETARRRLQDAGYHVNESDHGGYVFLELPADENGDTEAILEMSPEGEIRQTGSQHVPTWARDAFAEVVGPKSARYAQYQEPGADPSTYREVLLTMPPVPSDFDPAKVEIKRHRPSVTQGETSIWYDGRKLMTYGDDPTWNGSAYVQKDDAHWMEVARHIYDSGDRINRLGPLAVIPRWKDGHDKYDEVDNPIVRLRFNVRDDHSVFTTRLDGNELAFGPGRVLFLEEVQPPSPENQKLMPPLLREHWREIAFKWALRHAAEQDLDGVAWTTGQMQADRWSLEKHVDAIEWGWPDRRQQHTSEDAFRHVIVTLKHEEDKRLAFWVNEQGRVVDTSTFSARQLLDKDLAEVIGKEVAERILREERGTLKGEGLKIGGAGLKRLYDVDFRNVAQNLPAVKKAGVRVGDASIQVVDRDQRNIQQDRPPMVSERVPVLRINEALRTSVLGGQPLFARTEGGRIKAGIGDEGAAARIMASSLYSKDIGFVATKELLQNAFDAIRSRGDDGSVTVRFTGYKDKDTYVEVADTGKGMTRPELETVFTNLFDSGKRDDATAAGGFGIAKASFLLGGKSVEMETVVEVEEAAEGLFGRLRGHKKKVKYSFTATPAELTSADGVHVRSEDVAASTPTGTRVRTYLAENTDLWQARAFAQNVAAFSSTLPGQFRVLTGTTENASSSPRSRRSEFEKFQTVQATVPGATLTIRTSPKRAAPSSNVTLNVLNNGVFQFIEGVSTADPNKAGEWFGPKLELPERVMVDVRASVAEGDPAYPFTANREQLRDAFKEAMRKAVYARVIAPIRAAAQDTLQTTYDQMLTIDIGGRRVPVLDSGKRLKKGELAEIFADPKVQQIVTTAVDVVSEVLDKSIPTGERAGIERVGILFHDNVHGVFIPNPATAGKEGAARRATILINPFQHLVEDPTPEAAAAAVYHTAVHEAVHWTVGGHNENFTSTLGATFRKLGARLEVSALHRLMEAYGDSRNEDALDRGVARAFSLYQESRKRPLVEADALSGTGDHAIGSEDQPGESGRDSEGAGRDRDGAAPRRVDLDDIKLMVRILRTYPPDLSFADTVRAFQADYGEGARDLDRALEKAWEMTHQGTKETVSAVLDAAPPAKEPDTSAPTAPRPPPITDRPYDMHGHAWTPATKLYEYFVQRPALPKNNLEVKAAIQAVLPNADPNENTVLNAATDAIEAVLAHRLMGLNMADAHTLEGMLTRAYRTPEKQRLQQFSTPLPIAVAGATAAQIRPQDRILEPTAGTGNLIAPFKGMTDRVTAIELDPSRVSLLKRVGWNTVEADYLKHAIAKHAYDVIVTNPPWGKYTTGKYGQPIAATFTPGDVAERFVAKNVLELKPGGRLVVVMPTTMLGPSGVAFRGFLDKHGVIRAIIKSPPNAYTTRGTDVESVLLVFDKFNPGVALPTVPRVQKLDTASWEDYTEAVGRIAERASTERAADSPVATSGPPASRPARPQSARPAAGSAGQRPGGVSGPAGDAVRPQPERPQAPPVVADVRPSDRGSVADAGRPRAGAAGPAPESATRGLSEAALDAFRAAERSERFSPYRLRTALDGVRHPRIMVEARGLAGVQYPDLTYEPTERFTQIIRDGRASIEQAEQALAAVQANLVNHHGMLAADNVGVGKAREAWLTVIELMERAKAEKRPLRLMVTTKNADNIENLIGEELPALVGDNPGFEILRVSDYKQSKRLPGKEGAIEPLPMPEHGVYVVDSYNLAAYREALLEAELHGIVGDEAHRFKNAGAAVGAAWQQLHARIFERVPREHQAFLYLTATPAQAVEDYAYLYGLRMWPIDGFQDWVDMVTGHASEAEAEQIQQAADQGGYDVTAVSGNTSDSVVGADSEDTARTERPGGYRSSGDIFSSRLTPAEGEQITREWKRLGRFSSRDLWRHGTEFVVQTEQADAEAVRRYDQFTQLARDIIAAATKFGKLNKAVRSGIGGVKSQLQFAAKRVQMQPSLEAAVRIAKEHVASGHQVVLSMINVSEFDAEHGNIAAAIGQINIHDISKAEDGTLVDNGEIPEALMVRAELLEQAAALGKLPSPITFIEEAFGPENVAFVVGGNANARDKHVAEFQAGQRALAVISAAGSTGISLDHRVETAPTVQVGARVTTKIGNRQTTATVKELVTLKGGKRRARVSFHDEDAGRTMETYRDLDQLTLTETGAWAKGRRVFIDVQFDWSATEAIQRYGRVDRASQISAPKIIALNFGTAAEKKFLSTIANRLASLGALSKGGSETTGTDLEEFEINGSEANAAARNAWNALSDETKMLFMGRLFRDPKNPGYPAKRTEATIKDIMLGLMFVPTEQANAFWQDFVVERDRLREMQTAGEERRTRAGKGEVLRSIELSPELTIHQVKNENNEKLGILSGVVMPEMPRLRRFLTDEEGNVRRRYVTFTAGEQVVAGLAIPHGRVPSVAKFYGRALQAEKLDTPDKVREALRAGDMVPLKQKDANGTPWRLRQRRDGKIAIEGVKMADLKLVQKHGVGYNAAGNWWEARDLDKVLERFPAAPNAADDTLDLEDDDTPGPNVSRMRMRRPPPPIVPVGGRPTMTPEMRPDAIVKALSKALAVPVGVGRFRERALGIHKRLERIIRTRTANDLPTILHEFGHEVALNVLKINARATAWKDELRDLGKATSGKYDTVQSVLQEGEAEFLRLYLTNPTAAQQAAPNYFAEYERRLEGEPALRTALLTARTHIQGFLAQDPATRAKARIDFTGKETKIGSVKHAIADPKDWITHQAGNWVDNLVGIQNAVERMTEASGVPLPADEHAYYLARLSRGAHGKAKGFLHYGVRDLDFKFIGTSLEKALAPVGHRLEDFGEYLLARHAPEVWALGKNPGIPLDEAKALFKKHDSPEFRQAADQVYAYQDALLLYAEQAGLIGIDQIDAMKKAYRFYVPLQRVMDGIEERAFAGVRGIANQRWPVKRRKKEGSGRVVVNPLESIVKNTFAIVEAVEKNRAMLALVDQAKRSPGSGRFIEAVPMPMARVLFNLEQVSQTIRAELDAAGVDVPDNLELDALAQVFTPAQFVSPKGNVLTAMRHGVREFYFVHDPELALAVKELGPQVAQILVGLFYRPTSWLRAGATLTIGFIARNPVRDTFVAAVQSRYGFVPVLDTVRGLYSYLGADQYYQAFLHSGGANAALVSQDRDVIRDELKRFTGKSTIPRNPLEVLRALSEATENATRLGEFRRALKTEMRREGTTLRQPGARALAEGGLAARDVSIDFQRGGRHSRVLNNLYAFFNARSQGYARIVELARADYNRARTGDPNPMHYASGRAAAYISLFSALVWFLNYDDDDYKELPEWERNTYWHIPIDPVRKDLGWVRLPKPFEWGTIFGNTVEAALSFLVSKDPTVVDRFLPAGLSLRQVVLTLAPTVSLPLAEIAANYDFFRDRHLVSPWDTDLPLKLQASRWTSTFSKELGPRIGIAPAKLDHIVQGYFAGLGRGAIHAPDTLGRLTGISDKPALSSRDVPLVGTFYRSRERSPDAQSLQDLYDLGEVLAGTERGIRIFEESGEPEEAEALRQQHGADLGRKRSVDLALRRLRDLRPRVDAVFKSTDLSPQQKRRELDDIYEHMIGIARQALGRAPLRQPRAAAGGSH